MQYKYHLSNCIQTLKLWPYSPGVIIATLWAPDSPSFSLRV